MECARILDTAGSSIRRLWKSGLSSISFVPGLRKGENASMRFKSGWRCSIWFMRSDHTKRRLRRGESRHIEKKKKKKRNERWRFSFGLTLGTKNEWMFRRLWLRVRKHRISLSIFAISLGGFHGFRIIFVACIVSSEDLAMYASGQVTAYVGKHAIVLVRWEQLWQDFGLSRGNWCNHPQKVRREGRQNGKECRR
jgi:hypothetical protein